MDSLSHLPFKKKDCGFQLKFALQSMQIHKWIVKRKAKQLAALQPMLKEGKKKDTPGSQYNRNCTDNDKRGK